MQTRNTEIATVAAARDPGYSEAVDQALIVAAIAHGGQPRKGTQIPYVMHPFHVSLILDRHGFSESVVIAGLLHDVLEDTPWDDAGVQQAFRDTIAELRDAASDAEGFRLALEAFLEQQFGADVVRLVRGVSERKRNESGEKRPWRVRKEEQFEHLRSASADLVALKAADFLHNLQSTLRDIRRVGLAAMARFNANADDKTWEARTAAAIVADKLGADHSLSVELGIAAASFGEAIRGLSAAAPASTETDRPAEPASRTLSGAPLATSMADADTTGLDHSTSSDSARSPRVYLLNSPVLTCYGQWRFDGPVTPDRARELIRIGFVSAVGHPASAQFLESLLGVSVPVNRVAIEMQPGDRAVVLRLKARLPEGKVLTAEEMSALPFELGLLTRLG